MDEVVVGRLEGSNSNCKRFGKFTFVTGKIICNVVDDAEVGCELLVTGVVQVSTFARSHEMIILVNQLLSCHAARISGEDYRCGK